MSNPKRCNAGVVTASSHTLDSDHFARYLTGNLALVVQGGGQKGTYTAGVLDAFLLSNFDPFSHFYGTSAGALNILSYLCRQPKLAHKFITELTTDSKFFSLYGYFRHQKKMDIGWAIKKLNHFPYKLDVNLGNRVLGSRSAFACVTNAETMQDEYLPMFSKDWETIMEATCAIPHLYDGEVEIQGKQYVDGGVSASVPVQEAWRRGARCIVVIRTEPVDNDIEPPEQLMAQSQEQELGWYDESLQKLQEYWNEQKGHWQKDWRSFLVDRVAAVHQEKKQSKSGLLNGGRWLFGAEDIYRLSQVLGGDFSPKMVDQLMVHYQTYQLTQQFLQCPPQDTYIVQIAPEEPLKSRPLLSDIEDIEADYQLGLEAGYRFIQQFHLAHECRSTDENIVNASHLPKQWDIH
jgi:predicted patatin/cPLA2 family phospholipase